jgi:hypothetical protein
MSQSIKLFITTTMRICSPTFIRLLDTRKMKHLICLNIKKIFKIYFIYNHTGPAPPPSEYHRVRRTENVTNLTAKLSALYEQPFCD